MSNQKGKCSQCYNLVPEGKGIKGDGIRAPIKMWFCNEGCLMKYGIRFGKYYI